MPESIYPTMEEFYADLGKAYAKVVRAFADAGCRYLQLDEVNLAYLCDPALREQVRARGDDPAAAWKGERPVFLPDAREPRTVPVFDGHRLRYGNEIRGPAMVEQRNTTLFVSAAFDLRVDPLSSFAVFRRGREDVLPESLRGGRQ